MRARLELWLQNVKSEWKQESPSASRPNAEEQLFGLTVVFYPLGPSETEQTGA
jgi:hypothetical protein